MQMFLQFLRIYQCIHFLYKIKLESLIKEKSEIVILRDFNVNYDVKANINFKVGLSRLRKFLSN